MRYKTYRMIQVFNGMVLGFLFGGFATSEYWIIPLAALPISLILMLFLRRLIKEVVADERTQVIAGKAARLTLTTGTMILAVIGIIMYIFGRDTSQGLQWSGLSLCYAALGLMVFHAMAGIYYKGKYSGQE